LLKLYPVDVTQHRRSPDWYGIKLIQGLPAAATGKRIQLLTHSAHFTEGERTWACLAHRSIPPQHKCRGLSRNEDELMNINLQNWFVLADMSTFEHLALTVCKGNVISFDETDIRLPNFNRLAISISFIHGECNGCFFLESSGINYKLLHRVNDPESYTRNALPSCGYIDCIFGKDAYRDFYPLMVKYLAGTGK
jgi:hypothetical protein